MDSGLVTFVGAIAADVAGVDTDLSTVLPVLFTGVAGLIGAILAGKKLSGRAQAIAVVTIALATVAAAGAIIIFTNDGKKDTTSEPKEYSAPEYRRNIGVICNDLDSLAEQKRKYEASTLYRLPLVWEDYADELAKLEGHTPRVPASAKDDHTTAVQDWQQQNNVLERLIRRMDAASARAQRERILKSRDAVTNQELTRRVSDDLHTLGGSSCIYTP